MTDVVAIGGCTMDLFSYASRFPELGETISGDKFLKGFGGNAANQCVMARRLGASVALIAKLGDDGFGHEYLQNLNENGIISDFVTFTKEASTSTASIFVTCEKQTIIHIPGATRKLIPEDVRNAESLIAKSKILLCSYGTPLDTLLEALTLARRHEVLTVVNAAPSVPGYECSYPLTDIICMNEEEAEEATGLPVVTIEDAHKAIEVLLKNQCTTVIITMGAKGAIYQSKDQLSYTHIPSRSVRAVDEIGAGDAFLGSLVYFLTSNSILPFDEMIFRSCHIASLTVMKQGTQTSYPHRKDLPEYLLTTTGKFKMRMSAVPQ